MLLAIHLLALLVDAGSFLEERVAEIDGKNCATGSSIYTVTEFTLDPNPPIKSTQVSMKMIGTLSQAETLSKLGVFVVFNGINFYQESFPESGSYAAGDSPEIDISVFFPSIAPPGNYSVKLKLENENGDFLNCWEYSFSL